MIRTCLLLPTRRIGAVWPLLIVFAVFIWLTAILAAHADRLGDNKAPAYTYYKQGKFYEAARFYHNRADAGPEFDGSGRKLVLSEFPPAYHGEASFGSEGMVRLVGGDGKCSAGIKANRRRHP